MNVYYTASKKKKRGGNAYEDWFIKEDNACEYGIRETKQIFYSPPPKKKYKMGRWFHDNRTYTT